MPIQSDVLNMATCVCCENFSHQANLMIGTSKNGLIDVLGFLKTESFQLSIFFF